MGKKKTALSTGSGQPLPGVRGRGAGRHVPSPGRRRVGSPGGVWGCAWAPLQPTFQVKCYNVTFQVPLLRHAPRLGRREQPGERRETRSGNPARNHRCSPPLESLPAFLIPGLRLASAPSASSHPFVQFGGSQARPGSDPSPGVLLPAPTPAPRRGRTHRLSTGASSRCRSTPGPGGSSQATAAS